MSPFTIPHKLWHQSEPNWQARDSQLTRVIVVLMQLDWFWYLKDIFYFEDWFKSVGRWSKTVQRKKTNKLRRGPEYCSHPMSRGVDRVQALQVAILQRWEPAAARRTVQITAPQSSKGFEGMHTTSQGEISLLILFLMAAQLSRRSRRPPSRTWQVFYCRVQTSGKRGRLAERHRGREAGVVAERRSLNATPACDDSEMAASLQDFAGIGG